MLNHRIRDLLFHYKKVSVFLKKCTICPSGGGGGGGERCKQHKKPGKRPLFDWIKEMTSDKR